MLFGNEEVKERLKNWKMYYQALKPYCKNNIKEVQPVLIQPREINLLQSDKTNGAIPNINSWWECRNTTYFMRGILGDLIEIYKGQIIKGYEHYCCEYGMSCCVDDEIKYVRN